MEYPAHVVEQSGSRQQYRWRLIFIQSVQEELRVSVSLFGRLRQPVRRLFFVLWDLTAREVQFAKCILGILVAMVSAGNQVLRSFCDILGNIFTPKV